MVEFIEFIKDMLSYIIIIVIIVLIRIYVVAPVEVVGDSMEPNFKSGNMLLSDQLIYKYRDYNRFDVIVFEHDNPTYLIKRIIGLPGEKINYIDNELYVNDKLVKEEFETLGPTEDFNFEGLEHEIIPDDMYFVMGDNRTNSLDSRSIGLISEDKIIGKPFITVWPIKNFEFIK